MGAGLAENFLAVLGVELNGDLVAHGAGRNEDRGLAIEDLGSGALESVDGGVFRVDVVADLRRGHGFAHGGCRTRDGVAAKIDRHAAGAPGGEAETDCSDLRASGPRTPSRRATPE